MMKRRPELETPNMVPAVTEVWDQGNGRGWAVLTAPHWRRAHPRRITLTSSYTAAHVREEAGL